jgi:hypothetical protein
MMDTIMPNVFGAILSATVLLISAYSIIKFGFFFALPYSRRREALDRSYDGKSYATGRSDMVLLVIAVSLAAALLGSRREPISFLGGLFVGATLIQLFFHAFHDAVSVDREAPEPRSPLKQMSYAIQDRPQRAWKEMFAYAVIVIAAVVIHFV